MPAEPIVDMGWIEADMREMGYCVFIYHASLISISTLTWESVMYFTKTCHSIFLLKASDFLRLVIIVRLYVVLSTYMTLI